MAKDILKLLSVDVVEDDPAITLAELCQYCSLPAEQVITMIEFGIIEPIQPQETSCRWHFTGKSLLRVQTVVRLQRDLGVNLEGAALAIELLDEVKILRQMVDSLQRS